MEKSERTEREEKLAAALRSVIIIFVMILIVAATALTFAYYLQQHQARTALETAKTVRLAAWSVSAEAYGSGSKFSDMSSETGFALGVPEKIRELSLCEGAFRLIRVSEKGYGIAEMAYSENGITVIYTNADGADTWRVFKQSALIS